MSDMPEFWRPFHAGKDPSILTLEGDGDRYYRTLVYDRQVGEWLQMSERAENRVGKSIEHGDWAYYTKPELLKEARNGYSNLAKMVTEFKLEEELMKKNEASFHVKDDAGRTIKAGDYVLEIVTGERKLVIRGHNSSESGLGVEDFETKTQDWLDVFPDGALHVFGHTEAEE